MFRDSASRASHVLQAIAGLALLVLGACAQAAAQERVSFPAPPATPVLHVIDGDKQGRIDLAQLEALGVYRIRTVSPWEKGMISYEGVLLRDALKLAGLDREEAVRLRASDKYTQVIPRSDWTDYPALLATRENGKLLTLREQGPTRLIYPISDYPQLDTENHKRRWVWLIESIEKVAGE